MSRIILAAVFALVSSAAFANNCPNEVKAINAALPKSKLDAKQKAEVIKLRDEGDKLHKAGKHSESMSTLGKAKKMLGI